MVQRNTTSSGVGAVFSVPLPYRFVPVYVVGAHTPAASNLFNVVVVVTTFTQTLPLLAYAKRIAAYFVRILTPLGLRPAIDSCRLKVTTCFASHIHSPCYRCVTIKSRPQTVDRYSYAIYILDFLIRPRLSCYSAVSYTHLDVYKRQHNSE